MKKNLILLVFINCIPAILNAQVGIGTTTPASAAQLELNSNTKGFLPPRMTTAERNAIVNPVTGLQVFNTTTRTLESYISGNWQAIGGGCSNPPTSAPNEAIHFGASTQIVWNWNVVPYAAGYKYNTVNNYNTATDNGNVITYTQTGQSCTGNLKKLYVWAYNSCGASPAATYTSDVSFPLTISKTGTGTGVITSSPGGILCGAECNKSFPCGTTVGLSATADQGFMFTGWSGACTGTGPCAVTMNSAQNVTANFGPQTYRLDLINSGGGTGTVTSVPAGINSPATYSAVFAAGTTVTLTPTATNNSIFMGWGGGGCTGTGTCTVVMNSDKFIDGVFYLPTWDLMVNTFGNGSGSVTSSPAGINCPGDCGEMFTNNTSVSLTASPQPGSTFTGWYGNCSGTGACNVVMSTGRNVGAEFTINTYTLNVSKVGSGMVTSTPAGISCGAQCAADYNYGATVTLTASPTGSGTFTGWTGACSGTGACNVTMNAAKTVGATFSP